MKQNILVILSHIFLLMNSFYIWFSLCCAVLIETLKYRTPQRESNTKKICVVKYLLFFLESIQKIYNS